MIPDLPSRSHGDSTRREFLRCAAGGLAAVCAVGQTTLTSAAESTAALKLKKGIKFPMIKANLSVLDKFKLIADLGFEGTEIHMGSVVDPHQVSLAVEATGVMVHGVLNGRFPDIEKAIDTARTYGGTSVLVVAGIVDQDHSYDAVYRSEQERIQRAIPSAERHGIELLIENVHNNFLLSPLEMARFLDELDHPLVGAYFDVGNVLRYGWPEQWIRILGKRIRKIDVKDYSVTIQNNDGLHKAFDVPIGGGDCNWPQVRRALAEINFTTGWATAEVEGGDRNRLARISEEMDQVLN